MQSALAREMRSSRESSEWEWTGLPGGLLCAVVADAVVVVSGSGVDTSVVAGVGAVVVISRGVDISVREVMSSMAVGMKSRAGSLMARERVELLPSSPSFWHQRGLSPVLPHPPQRTVPESKALLPQWMPSTGTVESLVFPVCARMGFLHGMGCSPRQQKSPALSLPWPGQESSAGLCPEDRHGTISE